MKCGYEGLDLSEAISHEESCPPPPGLVDLRHKSPPFDPTRVLGDEEQRVLREAYEQLRGQCPLVEEPPASEATARVLRSIGLSPQKPMFRLIGGLLAVALALGALAVGKALLTNRNVARATTFTQPESAEIVERSEPAPERAARPSQPASPDLPQVAVDALATGAREAAYRAYSELAQHESEPGVYRAAAEILARELTVEE